MRFLAAVAIVLAVTGCATMTRGTTQVVAINTPGGARRHLHAHLVLDRLADRGDAGNCHAAEGARQRLGPLYQGMLPGRRRRHCVQHGRDDGRHILLGGVIGIGVDAASGAMNSYTPDIQVIMTPVPGCRPAGAPPSARR